MPTANTALEKNPPTIEKACKKLEFDEDSSRMFMKAVMTAATGIPVMTMDEIRQRMVSVCVGNTKFQPKQWIPPNIAPIMDVIIMILALSNGLIEEAKKVGTRI